MPFYEALREALSTYEDFVHEVGPSLSKKELKEIEDRLGIPLPHSYVDFLFSFNVAMLFHETIVPFSSKNPDLIQVAENQFRIGEIPIGSLWMDQGGKIKVVDEEKPDPLLIGSSLEHFLESTLAREGFLYDKQGEFLEVFDEEGEILPDIRKKQIKISRKKDPQSSFYLLEEAEWLLEEHQNEKAIQLLEKALSFDDKAGPILELLASLKQEQGVDKEAETLLVQAAQAAFDPHLKASRFLQAAQLISPQRQGSTLSSHDNPPVENEKLVSETGKERQTSYLEKAWNYAPDYAQFLLEQIQEFIQKEPTEAQKRYESLRLLLSCVPEPYQKQAKDLKENLKPLETKLRVRSALKVL